MEEHLRQLEAHLEEKNQELLRVRRKGGGAIRQAPNQHAHKQPPPPQNSIIFQMGATKHSVM